MHLGFPIGFHVQKMMRISNDKCLQHRDLDASMSAEKQARRERHATGQLHNDAVTSTIADEEANHSARLPTGVLVPPHSNLHWHGRSRPRDPAHHFPNFAESSLLGSLRGAPKIQNRRRFTMPGRGWSSQPTIRRRLRNPSAWRGSTSMSMSPFSRPPTQPSSDFPEVLDDPSVLSRTTSF